MLFSEKKYLVILLLSFLFLPSQIEAQTVSLGKGSYSTQLPSGTVGPSLSNGSPAIPKIVDGFSKPIQSNDFWSSLIYPFFNNPHSNNLYAHPIAVKAVNNGLEIGYTPNHVIAGVDYLYPYSSQLRVSVSGLQVQQTQTFDYSDWTATALWKDAEQEMKATFGHGLPFVYFEISGGNAQVHAQSPQIWYQDGEVLGISVQGRHFGIFAPVCSTWSGSSTLESSLSDKKYLSVALLPDNSEETLLLFKKHAYAFVTNTEISWNYDESSASLTTSYTYTTEQKESDTFYSDQVISALYRHQWLHTNATLSSKTYESPRGKMKLFVGNHFTTELPFTGIIPALPDQGDYNRNTLIDFVKQVARENLGGGPTYENGKAMARFAHVIPIADQLNLLDERNSLINKLKLRLEEWFTAGGEQTYVYNDTWDVLTGYPSGFGADNQINDHHFHHAYAILSAAIIAQYDSDWAKPDNWGGMVNLLIKDANNWERNDTMFPFLRSHDAYAGHSWAAGHGDFGDGNNQESSSESINFATAVFLWGANTGQTEIRDFGIFLHTNEATAIENYWFDVDEDVFPANYPKVALGMVWGNKGVHSTWFGNDPEFIHGINMLPITTGSLYLSRNPEHIVENFEEILAETNGQISKWKDVIWQYLALADPARALGIYYSDINYEPFDGESRAHTLQWLGNLKRIGRPSTSITATIPTYQVFVAENQVKTYVAYNPESDSVTVDFSDGFSLRVPPKKMVSVNTSEEEPDAPVVLIITDKTQGKIPLTVQFDGSKSFDRKGETLTYLWNFADFGTSSDAKTSFTFTDKGDFWAVLEVVNESGFNSLDSVKITVQENGTPFYGAPFKVPGIIEAEHYDLGGEGIAYHDVDANNIGLAFRTNEGVDLENSGGGGFNVYWMVAGEWLEYTFEVEKSTNYSILADVSTIPGFGTIQFLIDNEMVSSKIPITNTGGWQNWSKVGPNEVFIEKGVHILRILVDSETDKTGWLFSLNRIEFKETNPTSTELEQSITTFHVDQNFPNPFNPETKIRYHLPNHSTVSIHVFDILGRNVQQLATNALKTSGSHVATFNGESLSSGVYFIRVRTDFGVQTIRATLMK
jgi:endoglucanase Acf2